MQDTKQASAVAENRPLCSLCQKAPRIDSLLCEPCCIEYTEPLVHETTRIKTLVRELEQTLGTVLQCSFTVHREVDGCDFCVVRDTAEDLLEEIR